MESSEIKWRRVTRVAKCKICNRPDWCTISEIGVCCMRVQSGKPMRNGGWLHKLAGAPVRLPPKTPEAPRIDAWRMMRDFSRQTYHGMQAAFAESIGVSNAALRALGCAWAIAHSAWAFPMKDHEGVVVGIRLRNGIGEKWAVRGSKSGLFYPHADRQPEVVITEGPTDSAAAIDLGLFPVGRPSCNSSTEQICKTLKRLGARRAVICSDNDPPGIRGAELLQHDLPIPSCIWLPPCKDLRQYLQLGGTRAVFDSSVNNLVWTIRK